MASNVNLVFELLHMENNKWTLEAGDQNGMMVVRDWGPWHRLGIWFLGQQIPLDRKGS